MVPASGSLVTNRFHEERQSVLEDHELLRSAKS
jgi:hypothetical protein